jgi:large subunit ribosomal protein L19
MIPIIQKVHQAQLRKDLPNFRPGDTVKVHVKLKEAEGEKEKERVQTFEGVVISNRGRMASASFTVLWNRDRAHLPTAFAFHQRD